MTHQSLQCQPGESKDLRKEIVDILAWDEVVFHGHLVIF